MSVLSKIMLLAIVVLALAGAADAGYAVYQHYAPPAVSSCNFNETFNCDAVNQSQYSEVMGFPVAGIGVGGYLLFAALPVAMIAGFRRPLLARSVLVGGSGFALVFSLALTYIEAYVLGAFCPLCLLSLGLVTAICVLSVTHALLNWRLGRRRG